MLSGVTDLATWNELKKVIKTYISFDAHLYTDSFLSRRVDVRLRATHDSTLKDYLRLLQTSPDERAKLKKELTIHVTQFFRDMSFFTFLRDKLVPAMAESKGIHKTLRIWSAGCSTGEEPLSVAICLYEALGRDLSGFRVSITATDLDEPTLEQAMQGLYEECQFRDMPKEYKERYFRKVDEEGIYLASEDIRRMIYYKKGNILAPDKPKNLDLILCRNTVIYFNVEAKSALYMEFYQCLNKGGFLALGKTEVILGPARDSFAVFSPHERVYLKE